MMEMGLVGCAEREGVLECSGWDSVHFLQTFSGTSSATYPIANVQYMGDQSEEIIEKKGHMSGIIHKVD